MDDLIRIITTALGDDDAVDGFSLVDDEEGIFGVEVGGEEYFVEVKRA